MDRAARFGGVERAERDQILDPGHLQPLGPPVQFGERRIGDHGHFDMVAHKFGALVPIAVSRPVATRQMGERDRGAKRCA